ncbi:MAG: hypothetical protein RL095_2862 [Verrucomicrobiota bacterium]|jgi:hypothetical protein
MFLRAALSLLFLASAASCAQIPPKESTESSESLVVVPPLWVSHSRAGDKAWQLLLPVYLHLKDERKSIIYSIPWSQSRAHDGEFYGFAIGAGLWCSSFDEATTGHYAGFGAIGAEWNDKGLSWRLPPLVSRSKSSRSGLWDRLCLYNDEYSQTTFLLGSTLEPLSIPNYRQQISPLFHRKFDATTSSSALWPLYSRTTLSDDEGFLNGMFSLVSIREQMWDSPWDPLTGLLYQERSGDGYRSWNSLFNYGRDSFPFPARCLIEQDQCFKFSNLDTWFWDVREDRRFTRNGPPVFLKDEEKSAFLAWIQGPPIPPQTAQPRPISALRKLGFEILPDDEIAARQQVRQGLETDLRLHSYEITQCLHLPLLEIPLWEESTSTDYGRYEPQEADLYCLKRKILGEWVYFHKEYRGDNKTIFLCGLLEFHDNAKESKRGGKVFWIPWGT